MYMECRKCRIQIEEDKKAEDTKCPLCGIKMTEVLE